MFHHILVADRPHTNTYNGYSVSSQCKKRKERERELFEKIKVKRACAKKGGLQLQKSDLQHYSYMG